MANRTTKVTLVAQVSQYLEGMEKAAKATRETGTEAEKLAQQKAAFEGLGRSALVFGALAAAGLTLAIVKFAEFDQAMSEVKAATQETTENMGLLREAALQAGADTAFSATEAANAIEELGKAGLTTEQILSGGLDGALTLAAAGGIGVAEAAGYAAIAMKQFGLEGAALPHVADLLAAGAGKAVGDVSELAQALNQAGLVADGAGQSIEDTTGVLAAFADAGLIGSDAGTSLKAAIIALQAPTDKAKSLMEQYNLSFYDGNGAMLSYSQIAGQLQSKLGSLTEEERNATLAKIFGNDALRSANVLYSQGAEGIQNYVDQTNDAGYAAQVAADRMDNLNGDLEKLGGAFDTALIRSGSGANDSLRGLVQTATFLVDGFSELPQPALDAGLAVGTVAAATALAGGAALVTIPKLAEMRQSMALLGVTGRTAAIGIGSATVALAAVTFALSSIVTYEAEKKSAIDSLATSFDGVTGSITDYTRELIAQQLVQEGALDIGERLGLSVEEMVDLTLRGKDAVTEWADAKRTANAEDAAAITQYDTIAGGLEVVAGTLDEGKKAWDRERAATESSRKATEEKEDALASMEGVAASATDTVDGLADAIRGFASVTLDAREAERQFQQAVDDVTQSIVDNGTTLDLNTAEGRANEAALDALAEASLNRAAALYDQTGSENEATASIAASRGELIKALEQYGITGAEAEAYADKLGLIPANIGTVVNLDTAPAETALRNFIRLASGQTIRIATGLGGAGGEVSGNEVGGFYQSGVRAFMNGGQAFPSGVYAGGQNIHKFAETGLPWETYISPKPGHERENIGYALESLSRLGFNGFQQSAPGAASAPSLDGMAITGRLALESDGFVRLIDGRIQRRDDDREMSIAAGRYS